MFIKPPGVEKRPLPSETRPEALIRSRCPLRTTRPLFVQPLLELSALTPTLIVKKVGVGAVEIGIVSLDRESGTLLLLLLSGWLTGLDGRLIGTLLRALLSSVAPALPLFESNSIDSTSST